MDSVIYLINIEPQKVQIKIDQQKYFDFFIRKMKYDACSLSGLELCILIMYVCFFIFMNLNIFVSNRTIFLQLVGAYRIIV